MKWHIPSYILDIDPYVPGKPLSELEREYGAGTCIKLASNENPLGASPKAVEALSSVLGALNRYPDGSGFDLVQRLAGFLNVQPENIVLGNGSDDLLGMLARVLLKPGDEVIVPSPSFLMYTIVAQSAGATLIRVPLRDLTVDLDQMVAHINSRTRLIFICNPNNPTGTIVKRTEFEQFLKKVPPNVIVVVDEAYIEFTRDASCAKGLDYLKTTPAVVTLRTFSKAYGLAGLRIGYGVMPIELAQLLHRIRMPFNVNCLAQAAACAALDDVEFLRKTIDITHQGMSFLHDELEQRKINFFDSQANFFLIDVSRQAKQVFKDMLKQGVIVRPMTAYGFPNYIRINIGLPAENQRFLKGLDRIGIAQK
ncbi:MAG: histidinol-phosphate transaminase [Desulfobacteraceae bacterium]|nr:histidinol-phosphate transaminase [Desulfobacteraceae bacterium]